MEGVGHSGYRHERGHGRSQRVHRIHCHCGPTATASVMAASATAFTATAITNTMVAVTAVTAKAVTAMTATATIPGASGRQCHGLASLVFVRYPSSSWTCAGGGEWHVPPERLCSVVR